MEQYFKAAKVWDSKWVTITSMYLDGDAMFWWQTQMQKDLRAGQPKIDTYEVLKKELKA